MEVKYKLVIVGDSGVGKTTLIKRIKDNVFDTNFTSTLGVDFCHLTYNNNGNTVKVYIWDTAGQEKFSNLINVYFRDIDGAMVVYDMTIPESFYNTKKWINKIRLYNKPEIPIILVGTKSDIENNEIDTTVVSKFVEDNLLLYNKCSSKNNININETFDMIIEKMCGSGSKYRSTNVDIDIIKPKTCCSIL